MTEQEVQFEGAMRILGVAFVPGRDAGAPRIDYYIPGADLYVELKTWETERLHAQLKSVSGKSVMVLAGPDSVDAFVKLLEHIFEEAVKP